MNMSTEPKQDRNVKARASELLQCPFCPSELSKPERTVRYSYISGKLCSIRCQRCNSQSGEFHTEDEAIAAWNARPSQPPRNVEAGDAVRGVVSEAIMQKWNDPEWREWAKVNSEVEYLQAEMAVTVGTERAMHNAWRKRAEEAESHLALSATGKRYPDDPMESVKSNQKFRDANATRHDARGGDGELANKVKELLINHDNDDIKGINCHYCCSWREDAFKILKKNALAIIAASTNAERLRKIIKAAGEVSPAHMPLSLRNVLAEIGPLSPAQTPGDERQG